MAAIPSTAAGFIGPDGYEQRGRITDAESEGALANTDLLDHEVNSQPLDVYLYYAAIEREREAQGDDGVSTFGLIRQGLTRRKAQPVVDAPNATEHSDGSSQGGDRSEKKDEAGNNNATITTVNVITDSERTAAYRALRTASWQGVFFLITTDILGPSSAPAALASLGYGGGILVYTAFFFLAVVAGQSLWRLYCRTDSSRFPVKNYSDLGERLVGRWFRHVCNLVQSLQLFLNVAILVLGNGQTLATMIDYKFCFLALNIFFSLFGGIVGQIKSLRNLSYISNFNVWLNVITILLAIIGCSIYAPVPTLNFPTYKPPYPAVVHTAFAPAGSNWYVQINGVIYAVFAYGGAMIFVEFMAEMKKPMSFWKAALTAQSFIYIVYLLYGCIIYHAQGQYSYIIPTLSIANNGMLIASNVFAIVTAQIAAILYGNIGVKVFYYNVLQQYFRAPPLHTRGGRGFWVVVVIVYWALAFIIGSAIPNISSLVVLVGSLCILQFTYTFPPILWLCYSMQMDAMKIEEPWRPGMAPNSNRIDTWRDMSRWKRGFAPMWWFKIILIISFFGFMALCGLGAYAGVEGIITTFKQAGSASSFSCRAPGQPA